MLELPDGGQIESDRGAGQGYVFGSTTASLTLVKSPLVHRNSQTMLEEFRAAHEEEPELPLQRALEKYKAKQSNLWADRVALATVPSGETAAAGERTANVRQGAMKVDPIDPSGTTMCHPVGCTPNVRMRRETGTPNRGQLGGTLATRAQP